MLLYKTPFNTSFACPYRSLLHVNAYHGPIAPSLTDVVLHDIETRSVCGGGGGGLSRPSSALISWSSTQVLVDHWGTFCAGGYPNVHFAFFLPGDCGGV